MSPREEKETNIKASAKLGMHKDGGFPVYSTLHLFVFVFCSKLLLRAVVVLGVALFFLLFFFLFCKFEIDNFHDTTNNPQQEQAEENIEPVEKIGL